MTNNKKYPLKQDCVQDQAHQVNKTVKTLKNPAQQPWFSTFFARLKNFSTLQDFFGNPNFSPNTTFLQFYGYIKRTYSISLIYIFVAIFGQVRAVCLDGFPDHCICVSKLLLLKRKVFTSSFF